MELTDTTRAPPAEASASRSATTSAKWPRKLLANCISHPSALRCSSGRAMTPALFTRMCNGPFHARAKAETDARSDKSSGAGCDGVVSGGLSQLFGDPLARVESAHPQHDLCAGRRQCASGLHPQSAGRASDHRPLTGEVDTPNHVVGRGLEAEWGRKRRITRCFGWRVVGNLDRESLRFSVDVLAVTTSAVVMTACARNA